MHAPHIHAPCHFLKVFTGVFTQFLKTKQREQPPSLWSNSRQKTRGTDSGEAAEMSERLEWLFVTVLLLLARHGAFAGSLSKLW